MSTTELSERVTGDVVLPDGRDYETLRNAKFGLGAPALIVRVANDEDVRAAVDYARDNNLDLSVRSGAHGATGFGTNDGGLVIDLAALNSVELIDSERNLIRIGAGAQWGMVADALRPHGLAISSGDTRDVGVGGLLLHGGVGWKVRRYGLTLDALVAAEVVTAAGDLLRVDTENHPELFWAIRGGGGNLGVVTAFEVTAHPTTDVMHGTITYPIEQFGSVLSAWATAMRSAPEELSSFLSVHPAMFGPRAVHVGVTYDGEDKDAAEKALAPLRQLGTVADDDVKLIPYHEVLFDMGGASPPPGLRSIAASHMTPALSDSLIAILADLVSESENLALDIRAMGGAVNQVPSEATAFAHRDSEAMVTSVWMHMGADGYDEAVAEVREFWGRLLPHVTGLYANFSSMTDEQTIRLLYPERTYQRLAEIKRTYDPANLFHLNHNVPPAD